MDKTYFHLIEGEHLAMLKQVKSRLFSENRMNGDEMRNAAQTIDVVIRYAELIGAIDPDELHIIAKKDSL
jgi:hypothetical protein